MLLDRRDALKCIIDFFEIPQHVLHLLAEIFEIDADSPEVAPYAAQLALYVVEVLVLLVQADEGDRTYGFFNVVPRTGFERDHQAEIIASGGNFGQTNDYLSIGSHTEQFAYYASVTGNRSGLGIQTPGAQIIHDTEDGYAGFSTFIFNPTAEDQLRRVDIRAPQDGMVEQSTVHTVGGVITAGDAIMMIVPQADDLQVEAKVNPQDIDKLQIGQKTLLRLSAFNQRTTPELNGVVSRVSPDVTTDQRTGQSYYTIRVSMPPQEIARLGEVKLIPGMPAEAFVQTGDRTVISYLMKPLSDQLMRAFREK